MTINTSRKQVPASAKTLSAIISKQLTTCRLLNFGCGKWPELTEQYLQSKIKNLIVDNYDPNSSSEAVIKTLPRDYQCEVVLCANVLNVLDDDQLRDCIVQLRRIPFALCVIQIYEGNKSGNGKKTRDGFQRNARTPVYLQHIKSIFDDDYTIKKRKNTIYIAASLHREAAFFLAKI